MKRAYFKPKKSTDHLGNTFSSIKEMCAFHKVSYELFKNRRGRGFSLERSLCSHRVNKAKRIKNGPDKRKKVCTDHLGNIYDSKEEMLKAYYISRQTFLYRKRKGWDLEKILTY